MRSASVGSSEVVTPRVMQAMASSAMGAVSERVEAVASGAVEAKQLTLGGRSSVERVLEFAERGVEEESVDLSRVVGESSFTLALGGSDDDGGSGGGGVTVVGERGVPQFFGR